VPLKNSGRVARLFVLGTLAAQGPAHGHEIRRLAEQIDIENWSDAQVGSIYNALRRLESEGLIETVRTEQQGRRPTRTIYAITMAGRQELASLQDKLLYDITLPSDPFDIALWVSASLTPEHLAAAIDRRRKSLQELSGRLADERMRLTTAGYLPAVGELLFRHGELRVEAELRWHEELHEKLPQLASNPPVTTRQPPTPTPGAGRANGR
jgi:DNA-binding PadR family transcriptional regulator